MYMGRNQALSDVMNAGVLEAHFQPKFTWSGHIVGAEALARWKHPSQGMLAPRDFLPRCEQAGASCELACQMAWQAMKFAAEWRALTGCERSVAINVHPGTLLEPVFTYNLEAAVDTYALRPRDVIVEIIEEAFEDVTHQFDRALCGLKRQGFRLSIDDFGTGAAGLRRLASMPADEVKLAGCLVNGVSRVERKATILESVVMLAERLKITVVLEGVEHVDDLQWLGRYQLPHIQLQGFSLGRPMSSECLKQWSIASAL
ncbi:EAL domain-containing protein [Frateuria defendens]|uniref:EAL domain-containing protein n=1 Tax=Frateuria defendens TaxID=2219559 RepID=UPI00137915B7|nr:EAL domain-containing protein [Frateuria defendens]